MNTSGKEIKKYVKRESTTYFELLDIAASAVFFVGITTIAYLTTKFVFQFLLKKPWCVKLGVVKTRKDV